MTTIRRSKTMPTEGHATRFLYTILKQLDLKSIDWSLVATELDISNGHAARMRYSRFRQQMEGSATTISKTPKPRKTNGKTDTGKTTKQSAKGKSLYDKGKNFNDGKCGSSYRSESSLRKRPAPGDFLKQDNKTGYRGIMGTEEMNAFAPVMYDPFANAASYWSPSAGTILSADTSTFPYMVSMPDLQQQQQQQQHKQCQYPVDPFANRYLAPLPQLSNGEDMNTALNPGWAPQSFDQMISSDKFGQNQTNAAGFFTVPTATTTSVNNTEWNNQMDFCFSGCCQPPPPYPATPCLYPDAPNMDQYGDSLMSAPPAEPWAPPPPHNQWVPIKSEPGEEGNADDIFVKVEADA
ncbi:hypothetical protein TMatcc_005978 [Talaromyces marneffei ATCC 18224]|uniref:Myb-like DNA-binding domain-containing protein n=2 Tax=Talaromyces marneffei TaxID=37727 RepID=B6Q8I4_TALMQ|nr:conserved hypothetical protein [Talaromyces marneffei ATCC 18224]